MPTSAVSDPERTLDTSLRGRRLALLLAVVIVAGIAIDLVWFLVVHGEVFIGHADQANAADLARNVSQGRGAVVFNHWLYTSGLLDNTDLPHPEPYWPIYPSYVMAPFFWVLGPGRLAMVVAAGVVKILGAAAAGLLVEKVTGDRRWALLAGMLLLFEPSMLRRVNGLSDIYFASAVMVFAWGLVALRGRGWSMILVAGLGAAGCIGFRPPLAPAVLAPLGVLWLVAWRRGEHSHAWKVVGVALVGLAGVLPWIVYNLRAYGGVLPAGYARVQLAGAARHAGASHNEAFYDPTLPSFEFEWIDLGRYASNLGQWFGVLFQGRIWSFLLLLTVLVFGIALAAVHARARRDASSVDPTRAEARRLMVHLVTYFFAVGLALPALVHVEARYWTFLIPLTAVLIGVMGSEVSRRMAPRMPEPLQGFLLLVLVAGVGLWVWTGSASTLLPELHHSRPVAVSAAYAETARRLPDDAIVMNSNPWEFAFHTGLPAVMVPYTDDEDVILAVAQAYDVTHLVVVDRRLRHESHRNWPSDPPAFLEAVHYSEDLFIARFAPARL